MPSRIFAYGTLILPEVIEALLGRVPAGQPAVLDGFQRRRLRGRSYPGAAPRAGATTAGYLYDGIDGEELRLLDRFEGPLYERRPVRVRGRAGTLPAEAWIVTPRRRALLSPRPWDPVRFTGAPLSDFVRTCQDVRRTLLRELR